MQLSVSININKAKARVWAAITDIKNCGQMIDAIMDIEILNQPETGLVGLKWKEKRQMFGQDAFETMWITEAQAPNFYHTRAQSHGSVYITSLSLEDTPEGCCLTMAFSAIPQTFVTRLLSKPMGWAMKSGMEKMLLADLQNIKDYVEAQTDS